MLEKIENSLNKIENNISNHHKVKSFNDFDMIIVKSLFIFLSIVSCVFLYFFGNPYLTTLQIIINIYHIFSLYVIIREPDFLKEYEIISTLSLFFIMVLSLKICSKILPYRGDDIKILRKYKLKKLKIK